MSTSTLHSGLDLPGIPSDKNIYLLNLQLLRLPYILYFEFRMKKKVIIFAWSNTVAGGEVLSDIYRH